MTTNMTTDPKAGVNPSPQLSSEPVGTPAGEWSKDTIGMLNKPADSKEPTAGFAGLTSGHSAVSTPGNELPGGWKGE